MQALLELPKAGMGTILDPEYLRTYHSLYFYTYIHVYIYIYIHTHTKVHQLEIECSKGYKNWFHYNIKTLIFRAYDLCTQKLKIAMRNWNF